MSEDEPAEIKNLRKGIKMFKNAKNIGDTDPSHYCSRHHILLVIIKGPNGELIRFCPICTPTLAADPYDIQQISKARESRMSVITAILLAYDKCRICGVKAESKRLRLCSEHFKQYKREKKNAENARYREKMKQKGSS